MNLTDDAVATLVDELLHTLKICCNNSKFVKRLRDDLYKIVEDFHLDEDPHNYVASIKCCEKCKGAMYPTGREGMSYPPQALYMCCKCGNTKYFHYDQ